MAMVKRVGRLMERITTMENLEEAMMRICHPAKFGLKLAVCFVLVIFTPETFWKFV